MTAADVAGYPADKQLKSSLAQLVRTLSEDGRGPFQRWADKQEDGRGSLASCSDAYLHYQLGASYGGDQVVQTLQGAGLGVLIVRDLAAVVGPERAQRIAAVERGAADASRAADPAKATASRSRWNGWLLWAGGAVALALAITLLVVFAGLIVRIIAGVVALASLIPLYKRGALWKLLTLIGLFTFVSLNSVADKLEHRVDPAAQLEQSESASSPFSPAAATDAPSGRQACLREYRESMCSLFFATEILRTAPTGIRPPAAARTSARPIFCAGGPCVSAAPRPRRVAQQRPACVARRYACRGSGLAPISVTSRCGAPPTSI